MEKYNDFFKQLEEIRTELMITSYMYEVKNTKISDLIKNVSYECIVEVMELLDGYKSETIKCNLYDEKSKIVINEGIELHDLCEDFLDYVEK